MKRITSLLIAGITLTMLAACGDITEGTPSECRSHDNGVYDCTITLNDTRRVTCIAFSRSITCDWSHMDGSDNL